MPQKSAAFTPCLLAMLALQLQQLWLWRGSGANSFVAGAKVVQHGCSPGPACEKPHGLDMAHRDK